MTLLYQFPFSHYCEKARWALDYKGIAYSAVNLLPGFHLRTVGKLAQKTCTPVLCDGDAVVQDSSAIIDYLDASYPDPSLTPSDCDAARQANEWEDYFDEEVGVTLRLWFYFHCLPDRRRALRFLLRGATWSQRPLFMLAYPKVRSVMLEFMNINAESAREAEERLGAALDKLDNALAGRQFLVDDRFSRADLTACALLSPCCLPDDGEASGMFPPAVLKLRQELKRRRSYSWMRSIYEDYRRPLTRAA